MFAESVSGNLVGRLEKSCHLWEGNRNIVQIHVQCHVIYQMRIKFAIFSYFLLVYFF